jgi:uncharacterized lipoprotein YmbA
LKALLAAAMAVLVLGAATMGCSFRSAPPKTYLLSPASPVPAAAPASSSQGPVVGVGPVAIPAYLDRSPMVVRVGGDEVQLSADHYWAEPLKDGVARVIAENLAVMVPTDAVALFPWRSPWTVAYRVTVEILRLDGPLGGPVVLSARWRLLDGEGKELALRAATLSEPVGDASHGALVAAQSRMLAAMSRDIAAEIRARRSS